jgi:predicted nuclease of predicted toxin-antitoxin system
VQFLADENVPRSMVAWMRAEGHDVALASELSIGAPDIHWLDLAMTESRIIVSADKDFGELVYRDRLASHGIVLLRLDNLAVLLWLPRLQETWSIIEANPTGKFIVVTSNRVRVRPLV